MKFQIKSNGAIPSDLPLDLPTSRRNLPANMCIIKEPPGYEWVRVILCLGVEGALRRREEGSVRLKTSLKTAKHQLSDMTGSLLKGCISKRMLSR